METEAQTRIGALGWAPNIQLKSGRNEIMSKEVKTMKETLTETLYQS